MAKFAFRLEALLKLRRNQRDQRRQLLGEALRRDAELQEQRKKVEGDRSLQVDELRLLGREGRIQVDGASLRRYYMGHLAVDLALIERNRLLVVQQIALCRQLLVQADQAVKSLEKLEENQRAAYRFEQERRTARELEENWRAVHAGENQSC